jgi:hypothetical protein
MPTWRWNHSSTCIHRAAVVPLTLAQVSILGNCTDTGFYKYLVPDAECNQYVWHVSMAVYKYIDTLQEARS